MEGTGLSGALVRLQARFVDWLIGRSLRGHFRAVYLRCAVPEVVGLPPSLRFPPLREGNRAGSGETPLREGNRAGSGETPLREGNREGRTRSVPPAGRGNLEEGVGIGGLSELGCPVILFANHHYWWDGYLGYWLIRAWGRRMVVWMESYRRFPPFGAIGALPFPPDDPMARARTVKRSVQALRTEPATALLLFPEGTLHGDTERLLPFQRSLHWLACRAPQATLLPLAIHIEPSYHQYPRAYLSVGAPFQSAATEPTDWLAEAAGAVETLLRQTRIDARAALTDEQHAARGFQVLLQGALSIHERF
jgi:1-acyl-sn-glycerol-3-phosphate acyltransferase